MVKKWSIVFKLLLLLKHQNERFKIGLTGRLCQNILLSQ